MNAQTHPNAMQAFTAEAIPGGMRIVSPFRQITDRGGALDVGTITTEFISVRKDIISVRSYHYEGYVKGEPRYELNEDPQETEVEITEDEAVMKAGRMTVRVDLKDFKITYEADGKFSQTSDSAILAICNMTELR